MLKQERHTAQLCPMDRVLTRAVPVYAFAPFWKINQSTYLKMTQMCYFIK